ncbi:hypothetical protein [Rhizobium binxianense]|uniref:hypothetical protein n=1 Tax=Rhizobium binxianense TaxID=3024242 RepID=UPI0023605EF5|nr:MULTISPECIES: hypothetical protein [unclassified Rhizobium]MDC9810528.1 hypothetical protein [Rhizobium sp. MC62]WEA28093.1 hypothetical protein PO862_20220 [Rhizobium sp. MJ22]WEA62608.1 hypothetical protein PO860_19840 [Rhizobium sp. BJ04]
MNTLDAIASNGVKRLGKNDDTDGNADHRSKSARVSGERRDNQTFRNSIRAETTAAPASADAYHRPDYPTTPQTIATTNRNAAVKIAPWSAV